MAFLQNFPKVALYDAILSEYHEIHGFALIGRPVLNRKIFFKRLTAEGC